MLKVDLDIFEKLYALELLLINLKFKVSFSLLVKNKGLH